MMQEILAGDFMMVTSKGNKLNRMDVIRNVGSTEIMTIATIDSVSIRIFGHTALVVGYTHFSIITKEQTMNGSSCYSDLYIKRKGVWKAVAAHVTLIDTK
jgi:hypothetical protein